MIWVLLSDQVAECYSVERNNVLEYVQLMLMEYGFLPLHNKTYRIDDIIDYMSTEYGITSDSRPFIQKNLFETMLFELHKETAGNIYVNAFQRHISDNFIFVEIFYNAKCSAGHLTAITHNK